jgi:hypothetical protein
VAQNDEGRDRSGVRLNLAVRDHGDLEVAHDLVRFQFSSVD